MAQGEASPLLPLHSAAEAARQAQAARQLKQTPDSPGARASWLSRVTFSWLGPLLSQGAARPLEAEDLWALQPDDDTERVMVSLRQAVNSSQSLWTAIRRAFGFNMYVAGACKLIGDCCGFVGPICINALINGTLFVASVLQTLCLHQHHHLVIREAIRVRSALTMLVYDKSLTLSSQTKSTLGSGRILNMATIDANRILELFYMIHYSWAAPVQLIIGMLLLVHYLGTASFAGVAIMIVLLPTSAAFSSQAATISKKMLECTDKRLKFLTELFQHIRVIKFYAWESEMLGQVDAIRTKELHFLKKVILWSAYGRVILQAGPVIVSFGTFAAYSYVQSEPLTADRAFTAITLFSIFRLPLMALPQVFSLIFQANVSIKRLESFLYLEEHRRSPTSLSASFNSDPSFEIRHATFKWSNEGHELNGEAANDEAEKAAPPAQLSNITISIPKGKLTLVVGAVGSGKSTLLATLLGELQPEYGVVRIPSRYVSYAAQTPYLINASVQDNILFGAPLDTARLHRVIKSCELEKELVRLPNGFQSEIGENGVTLSGGQKQRLSIARAVYSKDQELYVFDDSLSALDAHVAARIFEQCFNESTDGRLAGRTRVLSTHSLQFAHLADWIIVMDNMRVAEMGTFEELTQVTPNGKFATMLKSFTRADEEASIDSEASSGDQVDTMDIPRPKSRSSSGVGDESASGGSDILIQDEEKAEGNLSWSVYSSYFVPCGTISIVGAFALLFATQVSSVSTDLWLTNWTNSKPTGANLTFYLTVYAYLGLSTIVLGFVGDLCCRYAGLSASKRIHHTLLYHVIKGTMRFYDTTPVGRILNRFSNDMNTIDQKLNNSIVQFVTMLLALLSMLAIQSSTAPILLILLVPVFICYVAYQNFYGKSCRELQRLDNISKSPVYAHITQTLNGLVTIRTFEMVQQSQHTQALMINENTKAFLLLNLINRWLGVRLEFLGAVITFAVAFFVSRDHAVLSSAMAGLLLSYSQNMTSLLNWIIRNNIDMENMMNSVERTDEYCRVDTEPVTLLTHHYERYTTPKSRTLQLRPHWPEHGKINFVNVCVKYDPLAPPVLHGISFTVKGGEKVGICGRTGAGKSSLLLALFRMVSFDSGVGGGCIYIDEVSTTALTLTELRSRMAIIPQDPVLFAASVRFNLDPTGQASDDELWSAIRKSRLETFVKGLPGGLDAEVLEGGDNFSVGERQLICLGRAILRNSKILCLDEATASMDHSTDEFIQSSIRREFAEATVLTIAHRVNTILDYHKIIVLKQGHIAEFGPPAELRCKPNGEFASMLQKP
ncbi:Multidrug resistance-associated protein 1 [Phytophthora fragariae]|uniref:Multidrug resistance-associated protein 1 n=1 Tax=Phytophthora fragariae TaxID=53985 RepID=A0A6A4BV06_9STRA|nr:Multidrug resistance-associated protein 1 [Phytophthora fragariae]KAE8974895.1 Multidrug resistance-associated protein 1 [Phytophthora fragariae]KAE9073205.1 Multidrug resistance-associated protein 1 [Phytophthora fragariae]KAE9090049.1 Multidrug resistance-associated protein 1 [Phytophthora fragariae]KAE9174496.1 Multidrug resistance-associated protein 1 [Phytophthora fragariae]